MVNIINKTFSDNQAGLKDLFVTEVTFLDTKDKNTTVCKLEMSVNMSSPIILAALFASAMKHETAIFTGVARLKEGDTYDEQKGKDIAEHRARAKAYKRMVFYLNQAIASFKHAVVGIENMKTKAENKWVKQSELAAIIAEK